MSAWRRRETRLRARCSAPRGARTSAGPIGASARIRAISSRPWRSSVDIGRAPLPFLTGRTAIPDRPEASERRVDRGVAFNSGSPPLRVGGRGARGSRTGCCYYFINDSASPSFVIDVSDSYDRKREALDCHETQFRRSSPGATDTRVNAPLFRQLIESRDAQFGALAGVRWAEGVIVRRIACAVQSRSKGPDESPDEPQRAPMNV